MARPHRAFPLTGPQRSALRVAMGALAILFVMDFFVEHHGAFGVDGTPGFAIWFGFGSAVLAVAISLGWSILAAGKPRSRDD